MEIDRKKPTDFLKSQLTIKQSVDEAVGKLNCLNQETILFIIHLRGMEIDRENPTELYILLDMSSSTHLPYT